MSPALRTVWIWAPFTLALVAGCQKPLDYEIQADRDVSAIIDQKWTNDMGGQDNYTVSDVPAGPQDVQVNWVSLAKGPLTVADAVALATAQNRQYQTEKETLYLQALTLTGVRHQYGTNPFVGGSALYAKEADDEAVGAQAGLGFDRFLATGAVVGAHVTTGWVRVLTGDLRSGLTSIFRASLVQPLLRGAGSKVALEPLTQAERDTLYQLRTFNRFRKQFVVNIISDYYRTLEAQARLDYAQQNYTTLRDAHTRMQKLAGAGFLPQFELDQGRQDVLQAADTLTRARRDYEQTLDEFKLSLAWPTTEPLLLEPAELQWIESTPPTIDNVSESDSIATAYEKRLDLVNQADAVEDTQRKVAVTADLLRPELNLVATMETSPDEHTNINTLKVADDFRVGMDLDLPLDRLDERNIYRRAVIAALTQQRAYDQARDEVALQVRQAHRDMREAAKRRRLQTESLALAQKRLRDSLALLEYGQASTRDVLDAQKDLFDAQNEAVDALVDYAVAALGFYRDTGILQVKPDGMWTTPLHPTTEVAKTVKE